MMWFWSHWKVWVKILLTVPLVLFSLLVIPAILLVAINPTAQFEKAKQLEIKSTCATQCLDSEDTSCVTNCVEANSMEGDSGNTSYEEAFKASYIKSCLATSSDKKAYCECTLKYLEDTVVDLQDTKEVMSSLPKAIESCKDKI